MADADRCPRCGSERPPGAPKDLCPRCLLGQALGGDSFSLARGGVPAATMMLAPDPGGSSVLASLSASVGPVPHVLLRDSDAGTEPGPVVQPGSPEMPVPAGHAARLQVLGEVARGGMGAILKGRDIDIGRDLAVKVLLEKHRDDPELIRRFIEEAQIAGQLQHPGVVPVYELGAFADRRPYFTMKLVKGRTLADLLDARPDPAADGPQMLGIFLQVCQTVAYAHARGVIHRDLKPSNVMVGSFGEVQVMDWGLAKVLPRGGARDDAEAGKESSVHQTVIATARSESDSDRSQAGSVMGTPAYMAPEQARGEIDRVDERADVFALGSILCEILTGRPAFTGRSAGEIQRKAERGDLADASARLDACRADAELLDLARACLAAELEDRPRDAGDAASGLSSYLLGVQERLRGAELARAAESARAEEAEHTAAEAERARAAESARAEEAQARAAVERSRRRRTMALAASLLAMTSLGGVTFAYLSHERQARAAAVERLLGRAATLLDQARDRPDDPVPWRTARAAVQQVEDDPTGITPDARDRLARLKADADSGLGDAERVATLRQALIDIRANQQDAGEDATDAAYSAAFRDAGLDLDALGETEAAARLRRRPATVIVELAAYLDHWSGMRREAGRPAASWRRPLEVARGVDRDDYRDRLRALLAGEDRKAQAAPLKALADEPRAAQLPAATAVLLGGALEGAGDREAAVGLLRRAAARHPEDVWVNFALAGTLGRLAPPPLEEEVRYYTAARALRPETAHDLAHLLEEMGRVAEAESTFRDLVDRRPDHARHLACFGKCLQDRGRTEESRQVLDRAVAAARAAVRLHLDEARMHNNLGNALKQQDKLADAEAEYRAAVKLKPDNAIFHRNLGDVLNGLGKPADAEAAFRAALNLNPESAPAHNGLGIALLRQGKLADAEVECRAALKLRPADAFPHNTLGNVLRKQGKPADAEAEYRAAFKLKPDFADAHHNLGIVLRGQGKLADAEAEFRVALRLNPDLAVAHNELGKLLLDSGERADAEAEFRAALKLKPDFAAAHYFLGEVLVEQRRPAEAEPEYRAALKLNPDDAETHDSLGNLLRARGDLAAAEAEFPAALKIKPDFFEAHNNLGNVWLDRRKWAEAEVEYRAALKLKSDNAFARCVAHSNLGDALWFQGKPAEAEAEFREALELKPDFAHAHYALGTILITRGNNAEAEAEAEYRAALKFEPDSLEARSNLGRLFAQVGRYAEALEELRRAQELGSRRPGWRNPLVPLTREVERLAALAPRLPAVLKGDDHPADAAERLTFARICYDRKLHSAAARLFAEALDADSKLGDDRQAQHPYNAACNATLAGCGQGKDDPPPDEAAQARHRGQALGWLKGELAAWSRIVEGGKPEARAAVRPALEHWKIDGDLAGVRDEAGLAKLPEEERKAWRALWVDVETLLSKAPRQ